MTELEEEIKEEIKTQPPYAVVILNDDEHTFDYVIFTLNQVFKYQLEKCVQLTTEIHEKGRAIVWSGSLEVAELKKEQIQSMGPDRWSKKQITWPLGVDLEPMA